MLLYHPLPFVSVDEFDYELIAKKVNEEKPDIIWVSWVHLNRKSS